MAFKLKRQILPSGVVPIVRRRWKDEELDLYSLTRKNRKELDQVVEEIGKNEIPSYLVKKKLKGKLGYGIFLHPKAQPILRGQVIGPYAGEVSIVPENMGDDADYAFDPVVGLRLTKEEQKKFDPKSPYRPNRLYALKLDAKRKGNFTRFINHSEKPNVTAYLVSNRAHPYEIMYIAKKKILPGEQLLVCYEDGESTYWTVLGIKPFPMTPRTFQVDRSLKVTQEVY